ncbi:MAG: hypothetical protein ACOYOJ_08460 [Alsobacter sp.]
MSGNRIQKIVIRAIEKQSITVDDVQDLRNAIGEEGFISRAEAEALIRMELMVETAVAPWADLFVETLTAHLVWDCRPTGYVRHEDAAWLAGCCARPRLGGGHHIGALMVALVREAEQVDGSLIAMALAENRTLPVGETSAANHVAA